VEVWSRRKDRKKKIKAALFPGYIFISCEMSGDTRHEIIKVPGVANIIGNRSGVPISIPDHQIESVRKIVESDFVPRPHPYLKVGDMVIVKEGQLNGATGYFIRSDDEKGKLIVSLDLLGRSLEIDIDALSVEKF